MGFVTCAGFWSRDHLTSKVPPTFQMLAAVGSKICGTQTSLAVNPTGAARTEVEAERRTARAVVNFMFVDLVVRERREEGWMDR